ncbi:hypothetical protein GCM10009745_14750 [Kribbella yunnanensis]|uniref:Ricin B lectin domain-containing protein n=1 Tax=Kribbella yunnanensis TaxID=190194 RepID=A0ABP4SP76_9ACTN
MVIGALVASTGVASAGVLPSWYSFVKNGETGNCLGSSSDIWLLQGACNGDDFSQALFLQERNDGSYEMLIGAHGVTLCLSAVLGKSGEGYPARFDPCEEDQVDQQWLVAGTPQSFVFLSKSTLQYLMVNPADAYARLYTDPTVVWPGSYAGIWCLWDRLGGTPQRCRR